MAVNQVPTRAPTIKAVASLAGVGIKTVSRVLNDEPNVRPEMRTRVLEAVAHLNYRRDRWAASSRRVLLATPHGTCAGVDRAVQTVQRALELYGAPVYVRKQIVHNRYAVETLRRRGAVFVEETDEVPEGAIVVFSAHGVAPSVHAEASRRRLRTIDATCPLVTKVHNEAKRFAGEDYDILLIGQKGHDEVIGTTGEAPEHIHLVDGPDDVANVQVRDGAKVAWLSQTTLSVDETMATVSRLRERFPQLLDPPSDDVCYAAQNRQTAVKNIAADIDPGWLDRATTVGLTGGASVPEILVHGVLDWLAEHGYRDVHEVRSSEETVQFALPHELRRDLRGTSTGAAGTR